MKAVAWGEPRGGIRLGLRAPEEAEAGGTVILDLLIENLGNRPLRVFGFQPDYPRSLRVSPPKPHRPHIRVSFGDVNTLHPVDAFSLLAPRGTLRTKLDLSFAFDRRGVGLWDIAFAYDTVRGAGHIETLTFDVADPEAAPRTEIVQLPITSSRSLREVGVDEDREHELDDLLDEGGQPLIAAIRAAGPGGFAYACRRVARVLSPGMESAAGWRALDALSVMGPETLPHLHQAREELPHAHAALDFAYAWLQHRHGVAPSAADLPFVTMLDQLANQPDARGNFVLAYTGVDSAIHGLRRVQLFGNGERIVSRRDPGSEFLKTRRTMLKDHEMRAVLDALRYAPVWLLRPLREHGFPDEPRPTLEVQLGMGGPFERHVAMWQGEWRLGPGRNLVDLMDLISQDQAAPSIVPPQR